MAAAFQLIGKANGTVFQASNGLKSMNCKPNSQARCHVSTNSSSLRAKYNEIARTIRPIQCSCQPHGFY